jgi:hypothetical protein
VYRKGAWVLHMLRHIVGDANFFEILHQYRAQYEYQTAVTEDFQAVAESVYGQSLEWFFEPWVYATGSPTYQSAWRNVFANGQQYVEVYFRQTQNAAWPTYEMPVDLRVSLNTGNITQTIWNDERNEHLLFPVSGAATALAVDPDNYVLHPTPGTTTFVEGPPKIVTVLPAPGSESNEGAPGVTQIEIGFHKNVNAQAAHFTITGNSTGNIPFSFSYNPATYIATLTVNPALAADAYSVNVSASLTDVIAGLSLDGEVADPLAATSLPSGDGLPGGAALVQFDVVATALPCDPDVFPSGGGGNGVVDIDDLLTVINAWGWTGSPGSNAADVNSDGIVNIDDLLMIINAWGPCP